MPTSDLPSRGRGATQPVEASPTIAGLNGAITAANDPKTMAELRLRTSNLSWREIDDEIIVLDLDGSEYISVRGAGRVLWGLLETGSTLPDLVAALASRYEIDGATASQDVEAFLAALRQRGLLEEG